MFSTVPSDGRTAERFGPQSAEVNSPSFTVVDEINIKPGQQGTFPEINWSNYSPYIDANHPEDPPWTPDSDWKQPEVQSPNDAPIPELKEYVDKEIARKNDAFRGIM